MFNHPPPIFVQRSDGTNSRGRPPTAQSMGGTRPGVRYSEGRQPNFNRSAILSVCNCQFSGAGRTSFSQALEPDIRGGRECPPN